MKTITVPPRPRARHLLPEWYSSVFALQAAHGLSTAAFARATGLASNSLHRWRARLGLPGVFEEPTDDRAVVEIVAAAPRLSQRAPGVLTVHLEKSRSIEVPTDFDRDTLARLVEVLESC